MGRMLTKEQSDFYGKEILITGGTGSLGNAITRLLCERYEPKGIRIYSRDEYKQKIMKTEFEKYDIPIAYCLGDVRDLQRLKLASRGVDIIIHTAALKDIVKCENDPIEAIQTNINGSMNVIYACIDNNIKKCVLISTDKAVYPVNLYGMTKAVAERLFIDGNRYSPHGTVFSVCRYGNVIASRGSVIELFQKQKNEGIFKITDFGMTRFWITLQDVAQFVINSIVDDDRGNIYIPKMKSVKIVDIAKKINPDNKLIEIGTREDEKLHECLITSEESRHVKILKDKYIIDYSFDCPIPFTYTSKDCLMSDEELNEKIKKFL